MDATQLQQIRLLLVDDEDSFRQTLFKRLDRRGIRTSQINRGDAALELLESNPMDVVVMDVKMPGLSGLEVLNAIKKNHPKTEVILLTGHTTAQDGVDGIKSGAFDYLSKPIEFEHLLGKIQQAYEKKQRDIERQTAAQYKAQIEQQMIATERLAALGTLAAGTAHEINNPLAIINEAAGFLNLLLKKDEFSNLPRKKDFEKALEKITKGVKRARAITHQLLGSVRPHEPLLKKSSLNHLVSETIDLVEKEAEYKAIQIFFDPLKQAEEVWIDANQIRQILINLLTNAIHATSQKGHITISLERTQNKVVFSVKDTGKGIPKENRERIFEPFFSDKPPGEGTGLGLFVTREIVEKLNGDIEVESKVGKGTTMTIILPLQNRMADNL
ncbi:MAG: ATP-binding protein [Desulfobacteraceae bacterium]|jgi:signal transduction histidine kinase